MTSVRTRHVEAALSRSRASPLRGLRTQGLCRWKRGRGGLPRSHSGPEPLDETLLEETPFAWTKIARQLDRAVADAQQAADLVTDFFPYAPHLTVAAFV